MKILYDYQTFCLQRYGGISRYFANLYYYINRKPGFSSELALLYSRNSYLHSKSFLPSYFGELLLKKDKKLYKWNKRFSQWQINNSDFDVLHATYYDPYFLNNIRKPFVITVHDMIHELFPEYFSGYDPCVRNKRLVIEKASHIIAISQSTKNDLQAIYDIQDTKISVVHHGYYTSLPNESSFKPPFENYILYVGDRGGYKNFNRFINAITPIINKDVDLSLICVGGGSFSLVEQELFLRKRLKKVKHIIADDNELRLLYKNALVFVYPSLYEGFGLPILEAFANNCPAVISNIQPFREVGSEGCAYFNPNDIEDISSQIERVIYSAEVADKLRSAGEIQLKKFSIADCVEKTMDVYRMLA